MVVAFWRRSVQFSAEMIMDQKALHNLAERPNIRRQSGQKSKVLSRFGEGSMAAVVRELPLCCHNPTFSATFSVLAGYPTGGDEARTQIP